MAFDTLLYYLPLLKKHGADKKKNSICKADGAVYCKNENNAKYRVGVSQYRHGQNNRD